MHFVYICRSGQNEELRYSIRSVVKNVPDAEISVVGGCPDWFKGHYIEVLQDKSKYNNAANNIVAALESPEIPEDFVIMNDDFFILKPLEVIPVYHGGDLYNKALLYMDLTNKSSYATKLHYTHNKLVKANIKDSLDYDLHIPFNVNKEKLGKIFAPKNTNMLWRSYYGNYYKIGGEQIQDVKIYGNGLLKLRNYEYNEDSIFLSTDEHSFSLVKYMLGSKFKRKSRFEKSK